MLKVSTLALLFFFSILVGTGTVLAQSSGSCDTAALANNLTSYATRISSATYDEVVVIADEVNTLLAEYTNSCAVTDHAGAPATELFTVQATGNVNIRSCGETTCGVVSVATQGKVYSVIGESGDWYEIQLDDGQTGYIASWLTVRGPDAVIDIYTGYADAGLTCSVKAVVQRSTSHDVHFAISGAAMYDVTVDILRPNSTNPEPVWHQYSKTFIDTGEAYTDQVYRSSYWPAGNYQLSLSRGGETRVYAFELTGTGATIIYVFCE